MIPKIEENVLGKLCKVFSFRAKIQLSGELEEIKVFKLILRRHKNHKHGTFSEYPYETKHNLMLIYFIFL